MKSLSKQENKERIELIDKLRVHSETVHDRVQEANEAIERLNTAIQEYNAAVDDANSWAQDIVRVMEEFKDQRSEKWQDSDTGQQYDAWIQSWADDFQTAEEVDLIHALEMEAADQLESRTTTPDET